MVRIRRTLGLSGNAADLGRQDRALPAGVARTRLQGQEQWVHPETVAARVPGLASGLPPRRGLRFLHRGWVARSVS